MPLPAELATLPIAPLLPAVVQSLARVPNLVLSAPPGAGKSTAVPLALLDAAWRGDGRLLLLEPRRLAASAVAARLASLLGERVGERVGLRSRLETLVSARTRIEVITEGVLTRMLQQDPALDGAAAVLFDEFHERSLHADLGLAFARDAQRNLRPDLRIVVMSATLEAAPIAALLGDAPVLASEGRAFPVTTTYGATSTFDSLVRDCAATVRRALAEQAGDVLVFLPGAPEIRRVAAVLGDGSLAAVVLPLYGDLSPAEQQRALRPDAGGQRKVVLATSIAETSLTIEGITTVIDSGYARRAEFDPVTGMSRLVTVRVSRAAAEQRRGRAGRLGPGACYRLWPEAQNRSLPPRTEPEILTADLTPLALELALWGSGDALALLDAPPAATLAQARDLLARLHALDAQGRATPTGQALGRLGTHPRLGRLLLAGAAAGAVTLAAELAALLGERDLLRASGRGRNADLLLRLEALQRGYAPPGFELDRGALDRARRQARELARRASGATDAQADPPSVGALLAFAYPDRIGLRRGGLGRFVLSNGRGATLPPDQPLAHAEWIVAADLDAGDREAQVYLGAALTRQDLERWHGDEMASSDVVAWDPRSETVLAQRETRLGAILLETARLATPDPDKVLAAMLEGVRRLGLAVLPWDKATRTLQVRAEFARAHLGSAAADWPDLSDAGLLAQLDEWLPPWLDGVSRRDHLARLDLEAALRARHPHARWREIDRLAPTHLDVPSGSRIPIDYADPAAPTVSVRLQELFGLTTTPTVAGGRVPLTLHLLSPGHRPVQVTRDLAGFWQRGYPEVRKELKGRYPKHAWPDDPLTAAPTSRARPRR